MFCVIAQIISSLVAYKYNCPFSFTKLGLKPQVFGPLTQPENILVPPAVKSCQQFQNQHQSGKRTKLNSIASIFIRWYPQIVLRKFVDLGKLWIRLWAESLHNGTTADMSFRCPLQIIKNITMTTQSLSGCYESSTYWNYIHNALRPYALRPLLTLNSSDLNIKTWQDI